MSIFGYFWVFIQPKVDLYEAFCLHLFSKKDKVRSIKVNQGQSRLSKINLSQSSYVGPLVGPSVCESVSFWSNLSAFERDGWMDISS